MLKLSNEQAQWLIAFGRFLVGFLFFQSGVSKLFMFGVGGTAAFISEGTGLPFPELLAILTITLEVVAGAFIMAGLFTRKAALALSLFTVAATAFYHPGWSDPDQYVNMMKNISIIGALLIIGAIGAGAKSLDSKWRWSKRD